MTKQQREYRNRVRRNIAWSGVLVTGAPGFTYGAIARMSATSRNVASADAPRWIETVLGQFVRSMRTRRDSARMAGVYSAHSQQLASDIRMSRPNSVPSFISQE